MTEKCQYCKRLLDDPKDPTTRDCGGDCLRCMAQIGEDPDCIIEILNIRIEDLRGALGRIAFSGLGGPYGPFGEALDEREMKELAKAALAALEQSK